MFNYYSFDLTLTAFATFTTFFIFSAVSLMSIFGFRGAFLISVLKFFPSFFYIFLFFDASYVAYDDIGYLTKSAKILEEHGEQVLFLMFHSEGIASLLSIAQSQHITYYWLLSILQFFFGNHYYVPVFFNVFLTSLASLFFFKVLNFHGFNRRFVILFSLFFAVHSTVISWASFMAVRDILILVLSLVFYYSVMKLFNRFTFFGLLSTVFILYVFVFSRFYTPVIMAFCITLSLLLSKSDIKVSISGAYKFFICFIMLVFFLAFVESGYSSAIRFLNVGANTIYGSIRFFLTPIPFNVSEGYEFLLIDSFLHWLFLPIFVIGVFYSFTRSEFSVLRNFLFLNILCFCLIFGSFEDQQGVRYRVQISYCIIFFQFVGLLFVFDKFNRRKLSWFQS